MPSRSDATLPVAYLTTVRLGEKGNITVPKAYREAFGLEVGTPMSVLRLGSGLVLLPEQVRFGQLCDRVVAAFANHGIKIQELLSTLPAIRERIVARHYPALVPRKRARKHATQK